MEKYCNSYLDEIIEAKQIRNPKEAQAKIDGLVKKIRDDAKANMKEAIVAYCYLQISGYKVEKNDVAGRERLSKMITKQRCPEAMYFVATAYFYGDMGYPEDKSKSEQWFRDIAINQEFEISDRKRSSAARYVAHFYKEGKVVSQDLSEAARFYEIACHFGCEESSLMLGIICLNGAEGVFGTIFEKDPSRGLTLLHALAEKGNNRAIEEVVKYHLAEAISWCKLTTNRTELIGASTEALEGIEWMIR
ncbi:tetratricopeptide repeat protein [Photobacterium galatheae]|uniref:Sel1 repeat protein n=1 Tax=Photobacterium galatheae TaxID=1654360 RepID=A0A066RLE1_9GAMM|nr:SEL1-like repeat protein [Photobacterium galatheae]KDM89956.1 hypothetical protein EA58_19625 [Photobacterium galatheae]MCM0149249.1 sel1 repeat family protein [Photobacterium galatheae]